MEKLDIIATINTNKTDEKFLTDLVKHGVTIMRLNGAHIEPQDIPQITQFIRKTLGKAAKIHVDLPGTKIRTQKLLQNIVLREGEQFELKTNNFNHDFFLKFLKKEDIVISSDGQLKMSVKQVSPEKVVLIALCEGELLNNKGIHVQNSYLEEVPFLSERDMHLIENVQKSEVDYVGLSFVRSAKNVQQAIDLFKNTGVKLSVKLETKEATTPSSLVSILPLAEYFSIDRGDLSSEIGLIKFPDTFNEIMKRVISENKRLFIATQLFASMVDHNLPYLSEVMEFHRLYHSGIAGIQLSEEIAVGKYPFEVLKLINSFI